MSINRLGLRKIVKSVRGPKGAVRRSYWVQSDSKLASKSSHNKGTFSRVTGKPITAREFMKQHGKTVAGYGATIGVAAHVGGRVARHTAGRAAKSYHAAELGNRVGQYLAVRYAGKALYNTKRGKAVTLALKNATAGTHLVFLTTHFGTAMASHAAASRIQHHIQYR